MHFVNFLELHQLEGSITNTIVTITFMVCTPPLHSSDALAHLSIPKF